MTRTTAVIQPKISDLLPPAKGILQRHGVNNKKEHSSVQPIDHQENLSFGQSPNLETQSLVEPRFWHDFSQVRVHSDSKDAQLGRNMNVGASEMGLNSVFSASRFESEANEARHLISSIIPDLSPTISTLVEPILNILRQPDAGVDAGTAADAGTPAAPTFPTYAKITANDTVSKKMDEAWDETKKATTATKRREQGFWIKYDSSNSGYTCAPTFTGQEVGPDETGSANPGAKPADSGTTYTVGLFHTHTPMTHRTGTRNVGPSSADDTFHTNNNVVGIIYDYKESPAGSGSIPGGHPLDSAAKLYSSGPTQRT